MALTVYDWIYGSLQLGAVFLSVIAGFIALSMFKTAIRKKFLKAWIYLIPFLVLFALEEIFGALRTFGIYYNPWITHVIPSLMLGLAITALVAQINAIKGWYW